MPSHPSRRPCLLAAAVALAVAGITTPTLAQPVPATQPADPFADNAPMPVVADEPDDDNTGVSYDAASDTLDIRVSNADLVDVLRMLAEQSERNLIASKNVAGVVSANLYDVTLSEALDAMLKTNGLAAREEGRFVYVYTQEELAELEEANRRVETKAFRLYHTPPGMAARMIAPALSDAAIISVSDEADAGVASNAADAGGYAYSAGDVIVISDFAENLAEVERLLDEVDKRPQQVLVEATILAATLTEDNQLGVDFNLVGGVDFNAVNFLPGGQIFSGATDSSAPLGGDDVVAGGTGNNFSGPTNGGLKVGFVSGDVSLFLSALEGVTDSTVLANPKVLAVNKQKGEVLVGRQDGYLTTTLTETSATQDVQFLETGTKLVFRPYISRDGYVRLEIAPRRFLGRRRRAGLAEQGDHASHEQRHGQRRPNDRHRRVVPREQHRRQSTRADPGQHPDRRSVLRSAGGCDGSRRDHHSADAARHQRRRQVRRARRGREAAGRASACRHASWHDGLGS